MAKKKSRPKSTKTAKGQPTKKKTRTLAKRTPAKTKPAVVKHSPTKKLKTARKKGDAVATPNKNKARITKSRPTQLPPARIPTSSKALRSFMDAVRKHLSRHCVLLSLAPKDPRGFEEWKFATGILLTFNGRKMIVTVRHWAKDVHSWREAGTLEAIYVLYTHVSEKLTGSEISPESISPTTLRIAEGFDAALIFPPDDLLADIEAQGNHCFTDEQVMRGDMTSRHLVILCGYPVEATIITRSPAFFSKSGGRVFRHDSVSLGSFAFQSTMLRPKDNDNPMFAPGFDCDADFFGFRP